jgi:tetratricopeptide (TPR) repeat protein
VGADLDTLQSLVDKSLIRHSDERFWMLETIREYAAERLEASGEAEELGRRHADHFLTLAEEAAPNLVREFSKEWLDRLEREHDNLRAALDQLETSGETELALRLAGAVSEFWDERGHLAEGRRRLERALVADGRPTTARARALNGAAALALNGGDAATARLRAEEGLALHRKLGDEWGTAESALQLGGAVGNEGDFKTAKRLLDESVRLFRELGDEHSALTAGRYLAWAFHGLGDVEGERALLEENLRSACALRNARVEASTLGALAMIAVEEGRVEDATSMLSECHRIHRERGDHTQIAMNVCRFARVVAVAGIPETATKILSASETVREQLGAKVPWVTEMNDETLAIIRAQLDEAAFAEAWEQGRKLTLDEAVALALDEGV